MSRNGFSTITVTEDSDTVTVYTVKLSLPLRPSLPAGIHCVTPL